MPDQPRPVEASHTYDDEACRLHRFYRGKMQTLPKCPIGDLRDFAIWYTPGVAAACRAIQSRPQDVFEVTNRGNLVAIVSDGTRVLGLGDIGPEAGLPVMEGKALLFKFLGGVDAVALCLRTHGADELIAAVKALEPSFGGINLEDISQPKCFRVLDALRHELRIPVWHDDQQGSATVVVAGLTNALELVNKSLGEVRLALVGIGAANMATYRLLIKAGVNPRHVVACDSQGTLHPRRQDLERQAATFSEKWQVCCETNGDGRVGGIAEALRGADACIAFSRPGPGVIRPEWVTGMARDAIVFACANPVPEIWPDEARQAGARIVGTGRSDFPNQVNNSLVFPAIFRGALDVRATAITDEMALAAARELATAAREHGVSCDRILPTMDDWTVYARVAAATAVQAQRDGVANCELSREQLQSCAARTIGRSREVLQLLSGAGLLKPVGDTEASCSGTHCCR
jgi:malate dehydrogenase (oxaloacetate-decarboxylating)